MNKIIISIFIHLFFIALNAQSFELLIPFNEDSTASVKGISAIEDENGEFFLLGLNIDNRTMSHHGYQPIGNSVFRLSNVGELIWKQLYSGGYVFIGDPPSKKLLKDQQGHLLLPYTDDIGIISCGQGELGGTYVMESVKRDIYVINSNDGELIDHRSLDPVDDKQCGLNYLSDFIKLNDYYYLHLQPEEDLYLSKLDADFNFIERIEITSQGGRYPFISEIDTTICYVSREHFYKLDLEANILIDIDMHNEQFSTYGTYIVENANQIAVLHQLHKSTGVTLISKLTNEIIDQHYFEDDDFVDIALLYDNRVLAILDEKHKEDYNSELPFKIVLYDTDLTPLKEKSYGFDAVYPQELSLLKDGSGFFVTGTKFQKSGYENGISKSVIYFLKDDLSSLEPVYRPKDEAPLGVNVFPNPTVGLVKVLIDPVVSLPVDLRLVSTAGQVMQELDVTSHTLSLDLSALPIGVYHLVLESGEESRTEKIVKMW